MFAVPFEPKSVTSPPIAVNPVPPFAAGKVPETCVVRPILPYEGATPTPPVISALPVAMSASFESADVVDAYRISPTA